MTADPSAVPDLKLEMYSQPRLLSAVRAAVGAFAQRMGFNEIQSGQISLSVDEALCNVMIHGYGREPDGRIWIRLWDIPEEPRAMKIVIEDQAKQVDPATIQPRDLDDIRPGGLGVHIIREIMDDVQHERRKDGGMRLILTKQIPAQPDAQRGGTVPCGGKCGKRHE